MSLQTTGFLDLSENNAQLDWVREQIATEYAAPHDHPWIIGFSGGKDSTMVSHLVLEHLLSLPNSERSIVAPQLIWLASGL